MGLLIDQIDQRRVLRGLRETGDLVAGKAFLEASTRVFEISNVMDVVRRTRPIKKGLEPGRIAIDYSQFPNVAPPFDHYWMEFAADREWMLSRADNIDRFGVWCGTDEGTTDEAWSIGLLVFMGEKHRRPVPAGVVSLLIDRQTHEITERAPFWISDQAFALLEQRTRSGYDGPTVEEFADRYEAEMRDLPEDERAAWAEAKSAELHANVENARARERENVETLRRICSEWLASSVAIPVLMAHSLLGCKNVDQQTHRRPDKLVKARKKRSGRDPVVRFTTLAIRPRGGATESGPGLTVGDGQTALHIVRGHFKTFTPDRPLLGRHVGTYWWSPAVRGNEAAGVVVKDYVLDPPK